MNHAVLVVTTGPQRLKIWDDFGNFCLGCAMDDGNTISYRVRYVCRRGGHSETGRSGPC